MLGLKKGHLTRPTAGVTSEWTILLHPEELESPSKTGEFDLSVALDSRWMQAWINPVAEALKRTQGEQLWDFTYADAAAELKTIGELLGVSLTLYQARHSGPSIDRSQKARDMGEVKKRGGWKSWKSLQRYEKSARLANTFANMTEAQKTFFQTCEARLEDCMLGRSVEIAFPAL
jgi:hypothetical protein